MRLLNTSTLRLEEFTEPNSESTSGRVMFPSYAILSHTWEDEEITFQDMQGDQRLAQRKCGFTKVAASCSVARESGYQYIWIDTCCIDKSSSAELSEAINSMYRWYKGSSLCFAYLSDVYLHQGAFVLRKKGPHPLPYRWFGRGWTLQELIAPRIVRFYSSDWTYLGDKEQLMDDLAEVTGIDHYALQGGDLQRLSIARRMSWAAYRQTTRIEDMAYCLLGIFDVNMPLIYGEGNKAFNRLQEEIMRTCNDQSIFAWSSLHGSLPTSLLASSPRMFEFSSCVAQFRNETAGRPSLLSTSRGIHLDLLVTEVPNPTPSGEYLAILDCQIGAIPGVFPCIRLKKLDGNGEQFCRVDKGELLWFARLHLLDQIDVEGFDPMQSQNKLVDIYSGTIVKDWRPKNICIKRTQQRNLLPPGFWLVRCDVGNTNGLVVNGVYPSGLWDAATWTLQPKILMDLPFFPEKVGALQVEFQVTQCVIILGYRAWSGRILPWCKLLPFSPRAGRSKRELFEQIGDLARGNFDKWQLRERGKYESHCASLRLTCSVESKFVAGRKMFLVRLRSTTPGGHGASLKVSI